MIFGPTVGSEQQTKGQMKVRINTWLAALTALLVTSLGAFAQSTNYTAAIDDLIEAPQTYFSTAITWSIGAIAVLVLVGWVLKAMRRR